MLINDSGIRHERFGGHKGQEDVTGANGERSRPTEERDLPFKGFSTQE